MHNVVRLPVTPRPRPVEDPAAERLPAAIDESLRIGLVAGLVIGAALLPWLLGMMLLMPRRRG